jgi:hypothetical protein
MEAIQLIWSPSLRGKSSKGKRRETPSATAWFQDFLSRPELLVRCRGRNAAEGVFRDPIRWLDQYVNHFTYIATAARSSWEERLPSADLSADP